MIPAHSSGAACSSSKASGSAYAYASFDDRALGVAAVGVPSRVLRRLAEVLAAVPAPPAAAARAAQPRDADAIARSEAHAVRADRVDHTDDLVAGHDTRRAWARARRPRGGGRCGTRRTPSTRTRISPGRGSGIGALDALERTVVDRASARRRSRPSYPRLRDSADPCRRNVSMRMRLTAQLRYHLWFAGMTYQGAVVGRRLARARRRTRPDTSSQCSRSARSPGRNFQRFFGSLSRASKRLPCSSFEMCRNSLTTVVPPWREQRLERVDERRTGPSTSRSGTSPCTRVISTSS